MSRNLANAGKIAAFASAFAVIAFAAANLFAQDGGSALDPKFTAKAESPSGLVWIAGDRGSPFMRPGLSCIDCHKSKGGPNYIVAGTVYTKLDEPDNVLGVDGAVVQIWDAKGTSYKMTANKSGNFFLPARGVALVTPLKASVYLNGKERKMRSNLPGGNCAQCHTVKGQNGAPGRIIAP